MQNRISVKILTFFLSVSFFSFKPAPTYKYPFQNPSLSIDKRVGNLVSLLTLDEKISQIPSDR
jgi:beta-glucosidase